MAASRHECSICMESFKNPKLISCHHSFCYKCLEDYVQVNLRNGCFNCPICRTSVRLPESGISGFQTNFYIDTDSNKELAITIGAKLNQAEKELQALRIQNADAVAEVNRYKREIAERQQKDREDREKKEREERRKIYRDEREKEKREERQIQAYRWWDPEEEELIEEDEVIKSWMCTKCQGWLDDNDFGFGCGCGEEQ